MDNCYLLIAVAVLTSVSCSSGSQDQVITTSSEETATLQCPIANQGSDLQSLYWEKDGTAIFSRTSDGVHTSGKYLVTDTSSLVIPDVTESDVGNYSCIAAFRKPYGTIKSDIMQLYVIDISVSHCKDFGQEVDGCSCYINGSNITSLQCSASGFPRPPVITWEEEGRIIYLSSYVGLTRMTENTTLICKARDKNLKDVVANKTVCVYYAREVTSTGGSPVEATTASVIVRALVAVIVLLSIALILLLLERYIRKKAGNSLEETDEPPGKDIDVNDAGAVKCVLKDASDWTNNATLQTSDFGDPAAAFDPDERDRDEREILISNSMPEFQEVTDESQISAYQGNRVIQPSPPMPAMSSSRVTFNPRPFFLRGELERAAMSNATSRIFPYSLVTGHSDLRGNSYWNYTTDMLPFLPMQSIMTSSMASSVMTFSPLSPSLLWQQQSSESAAIQHHFSNLSWFRTRERALRPKGLHLFELQ